MVLATRVHEALGAPPVCMILLLIWVTTEPVLPLFVCQHLIYATNLLALPPCMCQRPICVWTMFEFRMRASLRRAPSQEVRSQGYTNRHWSGYPPLWMCGELSKQTISHTEYKTLSLKYYLHAEYKTLSLQNTNILLQTSRPTPSNLSWRWPFHVAVFSVVRPPRYITCRRGDWVP